MNYRSNLLVILVRHAIGDLLITIDSRLGYVTASRKKFDRTTRYMYDGKSYPSTYVNIDTNQLVIVVSIGERLLNDLTTQYEVLLQNGELIWIWGNSLSTV